MRISDWSSDVCSSDLGFFGLLQPFADGLKLALKETIVPKLAVKPLFILGPIISFGLAIFGWALLPFPTWFCFYGEDFVSDSGSSIIRLIPGSAFIDFDVGLLFIFVIVALHVYGVLLGGWGSNSRYALRSEEHTSELQSLMRISYAVFCLKKTHK